MRDGEIQLVAAALAFWTILSLVPFLAVSLAIFRSFGGLEFLYPKAQEVVTDYFANTAGTRASELLSKLFERLTTKHLGTTGALFLFIASIRLLHHIEYGVNKIWHLKIERRWLRRFGMHLCFFVAFPLGLAFYTGLKSLSNLEIIPGSGLPAADFVLFFISTLLINKVLPCATVNWRPALWASLLSSGLLSLLVASFAIVAKSIFNYNKVYGSLAAIPLLAIWILVMWQFILAGAALCAAMQKDRPHDWGERF